MAIQACTVKGAVVQNAIRRLAGIRAAARGQFAGMPHIGMASLAQIRRPAFEQCRVGGAVGRMAGQAILNRRRVLPQERSARMGMALETLLVDGLGVDQFVGNGAVGVMAVRAFYLPFPNGMTGLP